MADTTGFEPRKLYNLVEFMMLDEVRAYGSDGSHLPSLALRFK